MILKFDEFLNEVRSGLKFDYFKKLMLSLGFSYTRNEPDHKFEKIVKDKDGCNQRLSVMVHIQHIGGNIDPKPFQFMKDELVKEFQYTGNTEQFSKVDWDFIGIKNPMLDSKSVVYKELHSRIDCSEFEIVDKIFKDVCVTKNKEGQFNLCKSENDKAPLLDRWYTLFTYNKFGKACLGYTIEDLNDEKFGDNLFEIKPDGTLGNIFGKDYVIESKINLDYFHYLNYFYRRKQKYQKTIKE